MNTCRPAVLLTGIAAVGAVSFGSVAADAAPPPKVASTFSVACKTGIGHGTVKATGILNSSGLYNGDLGLFPGSKRPKSGTTVNGLDGELAKNGAVRFTFKLKPAKHSSSFSLIILSPTPSGGVDIPLKVRFKPC